MATVHSCTGHLKDFTTSVQCATGAQGFTAQAKPQDSDGLNATSRKYCRKEAATELTVSGVIVYEFIGVIVNGIYYHGIVLTYPFGPKSIMELACDSTILAQMGANLELVKKKFTGLEAYESFVYTIIPKVNMED